MKKKIKIYELTSNSLDGYQKYLVRGIKSDEQGIALSRYVFGSAAWVPGGFSHYADYGVSYGGKKIPSMTIKKFKSYKKDYKAFR